MTMFSDDYDLAYKTSAFGFDHPEGLPFDHHYRLCHLPLANPGHPLAITHAPGKPYTNGRYAEARSSLVLPVALPELLASPRFAAFHHQVRRASFSGKINWPLVGQRSQLTHITLCGGLNGQAPGAVRAKIAPCFTNGYAHAVQIKGAFVGRFNTGRIYLKAYPSKNGDGPHAFHAIQQVLGRPLSHVFPLGLYNLAQPLAPKEAQALQDMVNDHWEAEFLQKPVTLASLRLLHTHNDLVLGATMHKLNL